MEDTHYLTKQRLKGNSTNYRFTPDIEDDETEDDDVNPVVIAVNALSDKITNIVHAPAENSQNTAILLDIVAILKQMAQKRKIIFKVDYNQSGDVSTIVADGV